MCSPTWKFFTHFKRFYGGSLCRQDYVIGHWWLIKSLAPLPSTEVKDGANVSNSLIIGFLVTSSYPVTVKGPPLPTTSHLIIIHMTFLSLQGFQAVKTLCAGTSLVVQWLRLHIPNAGSLGSIPGRRTRFHMLQLSLNFGMKDPTCHKRKSLHARLKILSAATKIHRCVICM